ncbi:DUF805 domain-containing protein [Caulobacter sp. BE254]|jgi:uncharacterized membrane protein YhaH (DUF805 family)|uniref:DUF805 domain-containing protein n=1 Tax=Caulobacter sp. BE254 TaxID=2817720 RepID=UPI00285809E1|nr:DUF805 domain-containing protein [Caulobacter sp. BE254]MDR7114887.1 uncharacterized membrane protein YhaH (DUF805 family) [Caulobacter sp. BE254]
MNDRAEWWDLFLSASGRTARGPFLMASAALLAFAVLYESFGITLHLLTGWLVYPPLLFFATCVLSKRLHDRGRSGWWAALVLLSLVAVWPTPRHFLDFLFSGVVVWAIVELGVMPSEQGANRYGLNPLKPASAV